MSASLSVSPHVGLAPGTVIGNRYRIDGLLGAGGMGVVLSATHLELGSPVAIKIVREEFAKNETIVARLLFEARAAARLKSSHVVRVLDVARLDTGAPYIVMEQLDGSDLQVALAKRGALSVREAVCHVLQACEGLAEAHGLGIIHRDLKPENLFLATTPEGVVLKILDFGISKDVSTSYQSGSRSTLTKAGLAVGSPYYMAPEQMRASPQLDARADIWSLGAILFELVTGRCPFEGNSPAELCTKVMCEDAPSLLAFSSAIPIAFDAIVRRCLQKEPGARFQTVADLSQALRSFSEGEERALGDRPRMASGISFKNEASQAMHALQSTDADEPAPTGQKKTLYQLLGVCALLVVAGIVFWQLQTRPDRRSALATPADTVQLSTRAVPEAARRPEQPAVAQPVALPSATEVASPTAAPRDSRAVGSPAATSRASAAPSRPLSLPQRQAAPDPDGLATRYGL